MTDLDFFGRRQRNGYHINLNTAMALRPSFRPCLPQGESEMNKLKKRLQRQAEEKKGGGGCVRGYLCQEVEGLWIFSEKVKFKDGLRVREIEFLKICIQASFWASKIWNPCTNRDFDKSPSKSTNGLGSTAQSPILLILDEIVKFILPKEWDMTTVQIGLSSTNCYMCNL